VTSPVLRLAWAVCHGVTHNKTSVNRQKNADKDRESSDNDEQLLLQLICITANDSTTGGVNKYIQTSC